MGMAGLVWIGRSYPLGRRGSNIINLAVALVVAGSIIGTLLVPSTAGEPMPFITQLLLPKRDNRGRPFGHKLYRAFHARLIRRAKKEICSCPVPQRLL